MANVQLQSILKAYGNAAPVLREVDLTVADGEFCVFVGPSGCGKSTLLRCIAGLEDITEGRLLIGDKEMNDTPASHRGVAMVFQSYALFPHLTVYQNLAFGLTLAKVDKATIDTKVRAAAKVLQLEALLERKPKALSGGQRQRVAIGRAIVREPGVFLFDEPLSNLDAALRAQTRFEIARLHRENGKASTIYVTHDQVEAMTLADRILLLHSGDDVAKHGSVAQIGTPLQLYHFPKSQFVAGFIGSPKMNFLPGKLLSADSNSASVQLPCGTILKAAVDAQSLTIGSNVTLGIRPEHAELGSATQHLVRDVLWQERLGDISYLYIYSGQVDQPWIVKTDGLATAKPGQRVSVSLPPQRMHLFDENGQAQPRRVDIADQPVALTA